MQSNRESVDRVVELVSDVASTSPSSGNLRRSNLDLPFDQMTPTASGTASGQPSYKLNRQAYLLWWQIPCGKANASFRNFSLSQIGLSLVVIPFWAVLAWIDSQSRGEVMSLYHFTVTGIVPWLGILAVFLATARRHLQHVTEARVSGEFLELISGFRHRKFGWTEILDLYPVAYVDNNRVDAYVLELRSGEQFVLSTQLVCADELMGKIDERMTRESPAIFQHSYRAPDYFFDGATMASLGVYVACCVPVMNSFSFFDIDMGATAIVLALLSVATAFAWIHAAKIPQIIRTGDDCVYLQMRRGKFYLRREEIVRARELAGWHLYTTPRGWFLSTFKDF